MSADPGAGGEPSARDERGERSASGERGERVGAALLRATPEDFRVEEIPLYAPSGEGGHTFLLVEKRGRTTEDVARRLARAADVPPRDVGYAGRKDRVAVTQQWFSVPGLVPERALALELDGARVLRAERHAHKLRTGQLAGNRFDVVARGIDDRAFARAEAALARLVEAGMPNRFGPQRFGRAGDNAAAGLALLRGASRRRDRREARFLVSALQAAVFNEALRRRALPLGALERGDVAVVHASGGLFVVEDTEREQPRADAFEISATGPIFGPRTLAPEGAPLARERAALAVCGIDPDEPLRPPPGVRVHGARRTIRVRPEEASIARIAPDAARLRCVLPAGSYVTVLLEALFADAPAAGSPAVGSLTPAEAAR